MELARHAAADPATGERVGAAREDVERGEGLAVALQRHDALTATAQRLASFGESAGQLPGFLQHAALIEAAAAQRSVHRAVTLLEPALILLFGLVVAFVATALLQAVYGAQPGGI